MSPQQAFVTQRVGLPPSTFSGEEFTYLQRMALALNNIPKISYTSFAAGPNSNLTGKIGDFAVNIAAGNAERLYFKNSGVGNNTGWVSVATAGGGGGGTGLVNSVSGTAPITASPTTGAVVVGVTSGNLLGTTNQITVSGGTAALLAGNATLSLPQNIHTGATAQFGSLGLGVVAGATAGTITATLGANNVTGYTAKRFTDTAPTGNFLLFQNATAGTLFQCDITGQLTAGSIGGSFGAINIGTNSLTAGAGTFSANVAVTAGGIAVTGNSTITGTLGGITTLTTTNLVGFGTATIASQAVTIGNNVTSGVQQYGIVEQSIFSSAATISGISILAQVLTAAAAFTMATAYGLFIDNANKGAGSAITTQYGLYVNAMTSGVTNIAIQTVGTAPTILGTDPGGTEILRIGGAFRANAASTITAGGIAVTGNSTITGTLGLGGAAQSDRTLYVAGSGLTSGTIQYGMTVSPTLGSGATTSGAGIYSGLVTAAAAFTMTSGYGIYIDSAARGAGSTITTLYGLFINNQTAGGTNYAIYTNTGAVSLGGALTVRANGINVTGNSTITDTLTLGNTLLTSASTTARAGVNVPSGTAPTSPTSGDFWYDGTNLKFRDGVTTRTITWT